MASVSLSTLRSKSRARADMPDDDFITDTELDQFINSSIAAVMELISNQDQNHWISSAEITASGLDTLTLPNDVYEIKGVEWKLSASGDEYVTMESFNFQERNRYRNSYSYAVGPYRCRYLYRPHGTQGVLVIPNPGTESFRVWYVPVPPQLVNASDSFQFFNSWDEWVVLDVAIKMLGKEQRDASHLLAQQEKVEERIRIAASRRNAGMAETMVNIYDLEDEDQGY